MSARERAFRLSQVSYSESVIDFKVSAQQAFKALVVGR